MHSSAQATGYIGKEKDAESKLNDYGARKYDEELGRFTTIDPLWEKYYGWSPYHYCRNNPIIFLDPSGLTDWIYTSQTNCYAENIDPWGLDWLIPDHYYAEKDGKRVEANSKETVTQTNWTDIIFNWETDNNGNGFNRRVEQATSGNTSDKLKYAFTESQEGGLMDQKHYLIYEKSQDISLSQTDAASKKYLYVYKNIALNWREAGNAVWGRAMKNLNYTIDFITLGAHAYSLKRNHEFDQHNEVNAFRLGWYGHKTFNP